MAILVFGILNAVLFLVLLAALALLRTPKKATGPASRGSVVVEATSFGSAEGSVDQGSLDHGSLDQGSRDQGPRVRSSREEGRGHAEELAEDLTVPAALRGTPRPTPRSERLSAKVLCVVEPLAPHLFKIDRPATTDRRSYIRLVAGLNGDRAARDELLCGVLQRLEPLGLQKKHLTATHCRLGTADGRTAAVTAGRLKTGEDRIELVVDHTLANEVLEQLERWHETELDASDRVQISALIR